MDISKIYIYIYGYSQEIYINGWYPSVRVAHRESTQSVMIALRVTDILMIAVRTTSRLHKNQSVLLCIITKIKFFHFSYAMRY